MRTAFIISIAFFLTACGTEVPPVTVTLTPTTTPEATATATIEPTPTLEPTPTIAPKPDYINDDNSVETEKGTVFVNEGKYMLYDPKTGEISEIKDISTEFTFDSMAEAQKVVLAKHAAEFANQNAADWMPGNLANNERHSRAINRIITVGNGASGYVSINGFKVDSVKIVNPTESIAFPEAAVIMLNVFGFTKPFPYIVGLFDASGNYSSFQKLQSVTPLSTYPDGEVVSPISDGLGWIGLQELIGDNLVSFLTLGTLPLGGSATYQEVPDGSKLSPAVDAERTQLLKRQAIEAEIGFDYLVNRQGTFQVGALFTEIENESDGGNIVVVSRVKAIIIIDVNH